MDQAQAYDKRYDYATLSNMSTVQMQTFDIIYPAFVLLVMYCPCVSLL